MICPNCGAQISDDARFCGMCGSPVSAGTAADSFTPQTADGETTILTPQDANPQQTVNNYAYQQSFANTSNSQQQSTNANGFNSQQQGTNANGFNSQQTFQGGTESFQNHSGQFQSGSAPNPSENTIQKLLNFIKTHIPLVAGAAAACLVLFIVIIVVAVSVLGKGYEKPVDAALQYRNKQSTDLKKYFYHFSGNELTGQLMYDTMELYSDLELEDYDEDEDSLEDTLTDHLEEYYDQISDIYGDDWEITYNVKRVKEIRESKLEDYEDNLEELADSLEDSIDDLEDNDSLSDDDIKKITKFLEKWSDKISDAKVTKGYRITVRMTLKGDEKKKSETAEIIVLKAGGKWVTDNSLVSLLSDLTEQDFDYYNFNFKRFF